MTCYVISYDLLKQGQDYEGLYEAIKSYGTWARINQSVWAVVTDKKAAEVREHLKTKLDSNDRLFVVRSGTEAAWANPICTNEWLQKHL
jgi:hypothetical protein